MNKSPQYLWLVSLGALILFSLLFIDSGSADDWRVLREAKQFGHVVLFALIGYRVSCSRLFAKRQFLFKCLFLFLLSLGLGAVTESIQFFIGRDFEFQDILNDIIGSFVGFSIYVATTAPKLRNSFVLAAFILVGISGKTLWIYLIDEMDLYENYDIISDFETQFQLTRWKTSGASIQISQGEVFEGSHAMQVDLNPGSYPGVIVTEFNRDWTLYQGLELNIYSGDDRTREYVIKIYDRWHKRNGYIFSDRFNLSVALTPGWNQVVVPMQDILHAPGDRVMNLTQIAAIEVFTIDLTYPLRIYIDNVLLLEQLDNLGGRS